MACFHGVRVKEVPTSILTPVNTARRIRDGARTSDEQPDEER